jgi:nucleolar MIF4G domain-containing protein 1
MFVAVVSEFSDEESGEPDYDINDSEDDFGLGVDDGSSEDFEEEGEEMGEDFELDDEQDLSGEVGSEDEFGLGADDGSDMEGLEEIYGDGKLEAMMELASGDDEDAGEMSDEIDGDDIEESNGDDDGDGELAAESRETGDGDEETEDKPAVGAACMFSLTTTVMSNSHHYFISAKYVPPHLRKLQQTSEDPKTAQMRKELRGLINRLGEGNLLKVAQSIEELYRYNSRNGAHSRDKTIPEFQLNPFAQQQMRLFRTS